jgi:putative ABC transport system permease protein
MPSIHQKFIGRPHLWLIRFAGLIVPRRLRADWRQEWEAELRWREATLQDWDRLDWRNKFDLMRRSASAFWDALWLLPLRWEDEMFQDLRYGARTLLKQPGFTLIAVLTLAVGIGANTAIFSVVNAALLRPIPHIKDEGVVMIFGELPTAGINRLFVSPTEYVDYRDRLRSFSQVGAYGGADFTLTGDGEAERVAGARVSANLLSLLGADPALGRNFLAEENGPGRSNVVILGYGLWQRRFGGDAGLIGRKVTLNGDPCTVVGVMPAGFQFPHGETEIWQPIELGPDALKERASRWLASVARLKPGVTMAQGRADLDAFAESMRREHPDYYGGKSGWNLKLVSLRDELAGETRGALPVLLAVVGCVLLIACANVANLLLARAAGRAPEMAVRAALGAGRLRVARQLLTESALLSLAGGGLGILLASLGDRYLVKLGPKELSGAGQVGIDVRVLAFTALVALLTTMLFGLAPAWKASKLDLSVALKAGGRGAAAGRGRLRRLLVIGEIAMALTLLVGAGLAVKSFYRLLQVDPGVDTTGVLTARLALSPADYPDGKRQRAFYEQALRRIEALPGVRAAGLVHNLPLGGSGNTRNFAIEGQPEPGLNVDFYQASPNYFRAIGMRLMGGRFFEEADREDRPGVAVVNETLARRFFPDQDPLGKRIKMGSANGPFPWLSIVGVARDVKHSGLDDETKPALYVCYLQPPLPDWKLQPMYLTVRGESDPLALLPAIRSAVQGMDRNLPVYRPATMGQLLARSLAARKFSMTLLAIFAAVALSLSVVGLYSVLAYDVTRRSREIGVRMALGARRRDVITMVLRQGMKQTLAGVSLGLVGAFWLTGLLKGLLFGVRPVDPPVFIAVSLLLTAVALAACYLPAKRASKVDPMVALREE